jgi:hypothetical protein
VALGRGAIAQWRRKHLRNDITTARRLVAHQLLAEARRQEAQALPREVAERRAIEGAEPERVGCLGYDQLDLVERARLKRVAAGHAKLDHALDRIVGNVERNAAAEGWITSEHTDGLTIDRGRVQKPVETQRQRRVDRYTAFVRAVDAAFGALPVCRIDGEHAHVRARSARRIRLGNVAPREQQQARQR